MNIFSNLKNRLSGGTPNAAVTAAAGATLTEADVKNALATVMDPDLHQDIVSLGFVRGIEIGRDRVGVEVNLTTPACPMKEQLKAQCEAELRKLPGITSVDVKITATTSRAAPGATPVHPSLANVRNIIAVAAGKGGVGKSTTAVNLAFALARHGSKVGLLDADIYGPSLTRMVRINEAAPASEGNVVIPPKADGVKVISMAMYGDAAKAAILRGPMAASVIKQFLTQVDWGELDYLVIDYPPGTGDIQLTISQTAPVTGAVIVTTPQEVALADVRKAMGMFKTLKVPVLGIIETMSYFICDDCTKRHHIFRQGGGERLAREHGIAFLGGVPLDPRVAVGGDEGHPAVVDAPESEVAQAYAKAARAAAAQLSILNAQASGVLNQFALDWKN